MTGDVCSHYLVSLSWLSEYSTPTLSTLRPRQDGHNFTDDIFKCIFLNENVSISLKLSLNFYRNNTFPALIQIMAWRRPGDKPLSEPMIVSWQTHVCVTRPHWVNRWLQRNFQSGNNQVRIWCYIGIIKNNIWCCKSWWRNQLSLPKDLFASGQKLGLHWSLFFLSKTRSKYNTMIVSNMFTDMSSYSYFT